MKQFNVFLRGMVLVLCAGGVLLLSAAFIEHNTDPKPFKVAGLKQGEIDKAVMSKLTQAYKAQFGYKAQLEQIKIVKEGRTSWLWFVGAGKGSPTFALELKVMDGQLALDFKEPLGINNCHTAGDCARCKVGCDCARDQGSDKCTSTTTSSVLGDQFGQFVEVLNN